MATATEGKSAFFLNRPGLFISVVWNYMYLFFNIILEQPASRIEVLAKPKRVPPEFLEDR